MKCYNTAERRKTMNKLIYKTPHAEIYSVASDDVLTYSLMQSGYGDVLNVYELYGNQNK